jgi:thiamine biosynthesis protein ThiS
MNAKVRKTGNASMVEIHLNGERRKVRAGNIAELILELNIEGRTIAIERNLEVVPKSEYASTPLLPRDRIEIVHMIGGG